MIDWGHVLDNSVWLLGLALILATFSYGAYANAAANPPHGRAWREIAGRAWTRLGTLLFCVGMASSSGDWIQVVLWALFVLNILYEWRRATRYAPTTRTADASFTLPPAEISFTRPPVKGAVTFLCRLAEWVIRLELLWLVLLSPFFLSPAPARLLPLFGLPALWTIRQIARGRFLPRTPLDWALVLLLIMVVVSLFVTIDLKLSLERVTVLLLGIGFYYAIVDWASTTRSLQWVTGGFLLAGTAIAVVGVLGTSWVNKIPALTTITSHLPTAFQGSSNQTNGFNSNIVGGTLLWVVPLQLALLWWAWSHGSMPQPWRWPARLGLLLASAVSVGTIVLTQSRGALSSVAASVLLLLWLAGKHARIGLAALLIVGVIATLYVGPEKMADKVLQISPSLNTADSISSAQGRIEIWSRAIYGLEDFPFTGMGMGAFRRVMPILYPLFDTSPDADITHAHNQFLQAGLDLGLPGLIAFIAIWMLAGALVVLTWRRTLGGWTRVTTAGIGGGLLASLIFGMTDVVVFAARSGVIFWALIGLLVALWRHTEHSTQFSLSGVPSITHV